MTDTVYTDAVTLVTADTMNDFNRLHYTIFGDPATSTAAFSAIKQTATAVSTGALRLAVQADQEATSTGALAVTPSVQQYHPSAAKAFARWSSTTTVPMPVSYNVSSTIVKVGTGAYQLRFVNNFSSTTVLVPVLSCDDTGAIIAGAVSTMTVSTCTVVFRNAAGALTDAANFYAAFYGDQ